MGRRPWGAPLSKMEEDLIDLLLCQEVANRFYERGHDYSDSYQDIFLGYLKLLVT